MTKLLIQIPYASHETLQPSLPYELSLEQNPCLRKSSNKKENSKREMTIRKSSKEWISSHLFQLMSVSDKPNFTVGALTLHKMNPKKNY